MLYTAVPKRTNKTSRNAGALALAIHLTCSFAYASVTTLSVFWPNQANAQSSFNAQDRMEFDIPAGPLSLSLTRFAEKAGIYLSGSGDLTQNKSSAALQGRYSVDEGLQYLLQGTGLSYRFSDDRTVTLIDGVNGAALLPAVTVSADSVQENALGAVDGYVANRSITAGKVDIPLLETPQSVNIVTSDQLTVQNAESLNQALGYTPGVSPMGSNNTTSDGMIIRGFNVTGAAPFYLNGAKLARNTFSGLSEPYAMERVEVLKGPASVLYGNAAPGGIVNMVSKLPQSEKQGEVKIQAGSFDRTQLAGDITGPVIEDGNLSYRLTGLLRRSDTFMDHIPDDRDFLQGSARWDISDKSALTFYSNYQNNDTVYAYGLPAEGTVVDNINGDIDRERFIGEPDFDKFETKNRTLGYFFDHKFNNQVTFHQNLLSFDADTDWSYLITGPLDDNQRSISRTAAFRADENASLNTDNHVEIKWDWGQSQHTSLVGVDYSKQEFERIQLRGTADGLNLYTPAYGAAVSLSGTPTTQFKEDTEQLGVYAQEHIKIEDRWVVMLGGRYDKVKIDSSDKLTGAIDDTDDSAFSGRAGLVYLFDNGMAPYVSYAQSFQPASGQDINGNSFEPTEGEQYELGMRYQPEGKDLSITASVYKLTQINVTTSDLANPGFSVQEGEVESEGFELEVKTSLADNFNLIASYSYIDNAVTRSNSDTEGNRFGGVPRHTASLWGDYTFSQRLGLGAGIRYFGESKNLANTYDVPGFTVVDAVINYNLAADWELALNINNLFDEKYATCSYACFYGAERSALATLTYNW